jgi:hypothetical protein
LLIALSLSQIFACGDDDSTPSGQHADTGVETGKTADSAVPPSDAGAAQDASHADAGANHGLDASRPDGGSTTIKDASADAAGNSGDDAGSSSSPTASSACLKCEHDYCSAAHLTYDVDVMGLPAVETFDLTGLCDKLSGNAADGPKKGTPRAQLCKDLLACARRTGCYKDDSPSPCVCGEADGTWDACEAFGSSHTVQELKGPCRSEIIAAAESTEWDVIRVKLTNITDVTYTNGSMPTAVNSAEALLDCGAVYCTDQCYAPCDANTPSTTECGPIGSGGHCQSGKCVGITPTYPPGPKDPTMPQTTDGGVGDAG